jgi:hypothetical protein
VSLCLGRPEGSTSAARTYSPPCPLLAIAAIGRVRGGGGPLAAKGGGRSSKSTTPVIFSAVQRGKPGRQPWILVEVCRARHDTGRATCGGARWTGRSCGGAKSSGGADQAGFQVRAWGGNGILVTGDASRTPGRRPCRCRRAGSVAGCCLRLCSVPLFCVFQRSCCSVLLAAMLCAFMLLHRGRMLGRRPRVHGDELVIAVRWWISAA